MKQVGYGGNEAGMGRNKKYMWIFLREKPSMSSIIYTHR
jgi:hypothetical protein